MTRWAIVADLNRCVGCQTCTAACKHANATDPGIQWRRVLDLEAGEYPDVRRAFVPVGCMHCEDPPCFDVCPSTATGRRADGIVTIDYDLCIGCAYCAVACPYQARHRVDRPQAAYRGRRMPQENLRHDPARIGVAQKCTFCVDRIDEGLARGLRPGSDPEATPACVESCIAEALHFGDLDDPESRVSELLAGNRHFRMHEDLGTGPGFHYLWEQAAGDDGPGDAEALEPVNVAATTGAAGAAPRLQTNWDWRAAINFMAGGSGTGLALATALAALAGATASDGPFRLLAGLATALVATGLTSVWFEIGRPWRFLNVFRHPARSWMTREAFAALPFFAAGAVAFVWPTPGVAVAAALFGMVFLWCQARIIQAARGIPAWREPAVVPLVMATGLVEGAGLFLLAAWAMPEIRPAAGEAMAAALLLPLACRWLLWRRYHKALRASGMPVGTARALDRMTPGFGIAGHLAPVVLVGAGLAVPALQAAALALAGLSAFLAGWLFKYTLIRRAAFNQGFAVARMPARGAGTDAPGIKPGWTTANRGREPAPGTS